LRQKLIGLSPRAKTSVAVIPMGISAYSPAEALSTNSKPRTILFIGRLIEIKGVDVLLRAMEGLSNSRLVVAGEGHRSDELKRLARSLSVDARFVGRIGAPDRQRLLSACDAVVIPSRVLSDGRTEGTPVVCLEAMAAGRAVIASRVGGLAEVIDDGENGLLFEQGDHLMLKEKLALVLSDDRLRLELAENAQRFAAAFEWSRIGSRYSRIIKNAVKDNDVIGNKGIQTAGIDR
jgi:glycosyltransferase involved in cell wall biosynthesis